MIMALGAQNLFVMEKGLMKDRAIFVAMLCSVCDVSLIFLGVLGAGTFFAQNAILTLLLKLAGGAFLLKYAYSKFREAGKIQKVAANLSLKETDLKSIILSTLAVSLLNPHVYLDTVVLIGGYSTQFHGLEDKLSFAMGAGFFSIFWFFSLSKGASLFSEVLRKPKTMKFINYGTSSLMTYMGITLILSITA